MKKLVTHKMLGAVPSDGFRSSTGRALTKFSILSKVSKGDKSKLVNTAVQHHVFDRSVGAVVGALSMIIL